MAQQTRTLCRYCKQMIWTINNDISAHYKMCDVNKQNNDSRQSSVKDWEIKDLTRKSQEWRKEQVSNTVCIICNTVLNYNDVVSPYMDEYVIHRRCSPNPAKS